MKPKVYFKVVILCYCLFEMPTSINGKNNKDLNRAKVPFETPSKPNPDKSPAKSKPDESLAKPKPEKSSSKSEQDESPAKPKPETSSSKSKPDESPAKPKPETSSSKSKPDESPAKPEASSSKSKPAAYDQSASKGDEDAGDGTRYYYFIVDIHRTQ
jgi:hypothetical protein